MKDMEFYKELIKRQAMEFIGVDIRQDAEEKNRIGFWVDRYDKKCARGISFVFFEEYVQLELLLIKDDYRKEKILESCNLYDEIHSAHWEFDKGVAAYGHWISYEMFLREGSYVFEELIGPIYEIVEEEFFWGLQRR